MTWQSLLPRGLDDGHLAVLVHRQEVVRPRGGLDRVDGDLDVAVGAVLEAHRRAQARGQLAVHLAFGGARADRAPADQVADVLRADHVQELAARRHAQAVDLHQQLPRDAQALVDAVALVQVRVVDQALPAHGGARLLEVHAHHDFQRVGVLRAQRQQPARVVQRRGRIVDGARADDHQQPVVLALHDLAHRLARPADQLFHRRAGNREEADQVLGRRQRRDVLDALVVGFAGLLAQHMARFGDAAASGVHGPLSCSIEIGHKKTAGCPAVVLGFGASCRSTRATESSRRVGP